MHTVRVTAETKENLPTKMLKAVKELSDMGLLYGLIHAEDDIVREVDYGWEMTSCWNTPEEVNKL